MNKDYKKFIYIPLIGVIFTLFDMMVRIFAEMRFFSPRAMIFSFLYGILLAALAECFKKDRTKKIFLTFVIVVGCALALSQSMYFKFYSDFYSFTRLSNIREFMAVRGETAKAVDYRFLFYPIIALGWIILIWKIKWFSNKREWQWTLISILIFVIGFAGIKLTFVNKMEDKTQVYLTDDYLYKTLYSKVNAMERFGVYTYSERDLARIIGNKFKKANPAEVKAMDEYFDANQRNKIENTYTNQFEGKNVVLILAESFNRWGINEEITPNLYKMKTEGIYFENYYAPTFQSSTIDAEFIINTGLLPAIDYGNIAYEFSDNEYPLSLANLFKEKGYTANSYHNSIGSFYNRYQFHEALGYEHFYGAEELGISVPSNFGYNWALDFDLFDKVSEQIIQNQNEQPFFSYLITVSTHTPYDENRIALKDKVEEVKKVVDADSQIQYYLAAAKDLDEGIGLMMERFQEAGILEDTVFVLFGDHYSYALYHDIIWTYDTKDAGDFQSLPNVPLMIWTPGISSEIVENQCGQFDVYPTLANMFGLDYNPSYNFGNDIMNREENLIVLGERGSWRDDNLVFYKNQIYQYLKENVDDSYVYEKNAQIIEKMNIFQKLIEQDYFSTDDFKARRGGQ